MADATVPALPEPQTDEDRIAASLFDAPVPRNPYAGASLQDAPLEQVHAVAARDIERAAEALAIEPGEVPALTAEWVDTFGRYGLSGDESANLVGIGQAALRDVGAALDQEPTWRRDALSALRKEFGGHRTQAALDAARQLVAQDATLGAFLQRTGLGSHPRVVALLARKAVRG